MPLGLRFHSICSIREDASRTTPTPSSEDAGNQRSRVERRVSPGGTVSMQNRSRLTDATLCELQRVPQPDVSWKRIECLLLAQIGCSLTLKLRYCFTNWVRTSSAVRRNWTILSRLQTPKLGFDLIGLLSPADSSSTYRLITCNANRELCMCISLSQTEHSTFNRICTDFIILFIVYSYIF